MDVSDKVENTGSQHVDDEETSKQIDDPVSSTFYLQLGLDNDIFATAGRKWSQSWNLRWRQRRGESWVDDEAKIELK